MAKNYPSTIITRSFYILIIGLTFLITTGFQGLYQDSCIDTMDKSFRAHYAIMVENLMHSDEKSPLNNQNLAAIKENMKIIETECGPTVFKMSLDSFAATVFGYKISESNQQICINEILSLYFIFFIKELQKHSEIANEQMDFLPKISNVIDKFEQSNSCRKTLKNKFLAKIKVDTSSPQL